MVNKLAVHYREQNIEAFMSKSFILSLMLIVVTGCAPIQQARIDSSIRQAEKESENCAASALPPEISAAWMKSNELATQQCPHGTDTKALDPSESLKRHDCMEALINSYVLPVSQKKDLLRKMREEQRLVSVSYQKGEIDRDTANIRSRSLFDQYIVQEASYYRLAQCQNAALQKNVMPTYPHKALLAGFIAKRSQIGLAVDEGKLSPNQADIEIQKAFAGLLQTEQQANASLQAQTAQSWSQALDSIAKSEQASQQQPPNSIKNTNCQMMNNTMNCTSW